MKGRNIPYSAAEMAWLEANRLMPIAGYHRSFASAHGRADVSAHNLHALRKRKGWKTGRTGYFVKGSEPMNKGRTCAPGTGGRHPNARRTQFRKGQEPHNTKFLGHERISKDGYVEISVAEINPHTGYGRRYVHKHVHLWEKVNGPLPAGCCLKCLDDDKTNSDPSNWELISRGVLARLNGGRFKKRVAYAGAPAELKPVLLTLAKVEDKLHSRRVNLADATNSPPTESPL